MLCAGRVCHYLERRPDAWPGCHNRVMSFKRSTAPALSAALLVVLVAAPACSKSDAPKPGPTSAATTSSAEATSTTAPSTTSAGKPETVVFEVTGSGQALTVDLVPSGPDRLYNVPLPWSDTITVTPDVKQLQVVVVGTGSPGPGCKITLDGNVVAEQPVGGSAHCVFDRD
jgi:Mycobacterium membrane protein